LKEKILIITSDGKLREIGRGSKRAYKKNHPHPNTPTPPKTSVIDPDTSVCELIKNSNFRIRIESWRRGGGGGHVSSPCAVLRSFGKSREERGKEGNPR